MTGSNTAFSRVCSFLKQRPRAGECVARLKIQGLGCPGTKQKPEGREKTGEPGKPRSPRSKLVNKLVVLQEKSRSH